MNNLYKASSNKAVQKLYKCTTSIFIAAAILCTTQAYASPLQNVKMIKDQRNNCIGKDLEDDNNIVVISIPPENQKELDTTVTMSGSNGSLTIDFKTRKSTFININQIDKDGNPVMSISDITPNQISLSKPLLQQCLQLLEKR